MEILIIFFLQQQHCRRGILSPSPLSVVVFVVVVTISSTPNSLGHPLILSTFSCKQYYLLHRMVA